MYSLLSGLVKYVLKKDEYCVLIIGLDNAGKTTFLEEVEEVEEGVEEGQLGKLNS